MPRAAFLIMNHATSSSAPPLTPTPLPGVPGRGERERSCHAFGRVIVGLCGNVLIVLKQSSAPRDPKANSSAGARWLAHLGLLFLSLSLSLSRACVRHTYFDLRSPLPGVPGRGERERSCHVFGRVIVGLCGNVLIVLKQSSAPRDPKANSSAGARWLAHLGLLFLSLSLSLSRARATYLL